MGKSVRLLIDTSGIKSRQSRNLVRDKISVHSKYRYVVGRSGIAVSSGEDCRFESIYNGRPIFRSPPTSDELFTRFYIFLPLGTSFSMDLDIVSIMFGRSGIVVSGHEGIFKCH